MSEDVVWWPFVPTNIDGHWDFDRVTDFDLQPLYIPIEGLRRREEIARMPRWTDDEQAKYDEAVEAALVSDDVTAFLLDRTPRMYRLVRLLIDLDRGDLDNVVSEAQAIVSAIERDIRDYG